MFEHAWFPAAALIAVSLAAGAWYFRRGALRDRNLRRLDAAFERARLSKRFSYTGRPFGR